MAEYGRTSKTTLHGENEKKQKRLFAQKFFTSTTLKVLDGLETNCQVKLTIDKKEISAAKYSLTKEFEILRHCSTREVTIEEVRPGKIVLFKLTFPDSKSYLCEAKESLFKALLVESMKEAGQEPELSSSDQKIVNTISFLIFLVISGGLLFGLHQCTSYEPPVLTAEEKAQKKYDRETETCRGTANLHTLERGGPMFTHATAISPDWALLHFKHPRSGRTWTTRYACDF